MEEVHRKGGMMFVKNLQSQEQLVSGHLHVRNGYYYAVLSIKQDGKYKSKWFSTGLKVKGNKKRAEKILIDRRIEYTYGVYPYQPAAESVKTVADIKEKPKDVQVTLSKLYPKWIEYKSLHAATETYLSRIDRDWQKYYTSTNIIDIPLDQITPLMLDEWVHKLIKKYNMSQKQFYNATIVMRQALEYAVDLKIIEENPFTAVKIDGKRVFRREKKKESATQVFLKDELLQLEQLAWEHFDADTMKVHKLAPLAVLFQFQTGLRVGELCAVRYQDVLESKIHINRMFRYELNEVVEHTKGCYGDRYVILTGQAKHIIAVAKAKQIELGVRSDGYIFSVNDDPVPYEPMRYLYRKYCKAIGTINKSTHKARKTYISALIDGGVNINTIRETVGHCDERTTYKNYCFDRSSEEEKVRKIEEALS